jgi:UDPglucose--hexose-1-phosphate uridylyltransferase
MLELRKDYILDRWVIAASLRAKRPKEYKQENKVKEPKICVFCSGNENLTPPEIGRVSKNKKWIIRWFPNKFPFVEQKGSPEIKTKNKFFTSSSGYGKHEVIADTNKHNIQLWDTKKEHIKLVLEVIKNRIEELNKLKNIKYVQVFKNHGEKAGTSIIHSHFQITAISTIPPTITEKIKAIKKHKKCPYCDIIKIEGKGKRKCFENKTFLAFAPYASRFNYEIWIFPKKHIKTLSELKDNEIKDFSSILNKVLKKLKTLNLSYNITFNYSPKKNNLHFHIEVIPRIAQWAGFEFSTGITINSVMPEAAAKFYRN